MTWENAPVEESDETYPKPRAGHCAVGVCQYIIMYQILGLALKLLCLISMICHDLS